MAITHAHRDQIELEALKSVMRSFVSVPLLYPTVCGVIAIYLPTTYSPDVVLAWWLVLTATQIEYVFYQNRFFKQATDNADTWTKSSAIRHAVMNTVWIGMVPLFWTQGDDVQNLGLVFIQVIHCLIASLLSSPRRATMFACSLPVISAAMIASFANGTPIFMVVAGTLVLTYAFLVRMGAQSRQSFENQTELSLHNQDLISELSRREDRFRALVDNAFDGIVVTDAKQVITYASPSVRAIGMKPEQMIGRSALSFLPAKEIDSILNTLSENGGQTPQGKNVEFHTKGPDGKAHWFESSITDLSNNPSIGGFVLNMRDITERKRSQMELVNQSRVLEALATGAPIDFVMELVAQGAEQGNPESNVAIYLTDDKLNLTVCASPSFPKHFKQAISDFWDNNKTKAFGDVVTRDEGLLVMEDLLDFTDQPDVIEFAKTYGVRALWMQRFKASDVDGGSGSIAVYLKEPRKPSKWEASYLQGTAQLASIAVNRRRAEQNLREATHNAELANRAKTKFLANMSHELRTPLNAIIGFSDIMKSELFGALGSPRYTEYAKDINDSGAHLLNVIDDILDISKIEAGRYQLEESDMDLDECMRWSIEMVRPRTVEKSLTVTLDIAPDLPAINADRRAIRQIMLNLLSNASKFTPEFGTITLTAQVTRNGSLHVSVADTGIGIPADKLNAVLEPFGQVDDTNARQHGGTGLGLSITKALAELHDGKFWLESNFGHGTTAIMTLPPQRLIAAKVAKKAAAD